ncbi:hypothetical protein BVRB_002680 [Beta vulgaris subsp. vulgaris]|uniref:Uncharacterized protein n=1 Tax=Beta vulgaris subsp. vulgaris TaxID=3555 RepID=A0A0J8DYV1_BETVV|nr:hypothetical protein BVRB_002680 [Beta vulgaris subsp. vulgaris]
MAVISQQIKSNNGFSIDLIEFGKVFFTIQNSGAFDQDVLASRVVSEPIEMTQEFRYFDFAPYGATFFTPPARRSRVNGTPVRRAESRQKYEIPIVQRIQKGLSNRKRTDRYYA